MVEIGMDRSSALSVLSAWRLVQDGPDHVAFEGDRAFWRWPPEQLWPLLRPYLLLGLVLGVLILLLVLAARTTYPGPDGMPVHGWRSSPLAVALGLGLLYVGLPLAWGLRAPARWEARPGRLIVEGRAVEVQSGVELHLVRYQYTTKHGEGIQKIRVTRSLMNVELVTPGGAGELLATFHEADHARIWGALTRLCEVSGARCVERAGP